MLIRIIQIILALALIGGLFFAGRHVYRSLPDNGVREATPRSELTIVMPEGVSGGGTSVELYPIDFAAVQRDFPLNARPGKSFEDFLTARLKNLNPVRARIDQSGRAVARLSTGVWWLRATASSARGEVMEWRLPLTISQPVQTIELSRDNAYERAQKF